MDHRELRKGKAKNLAAFLDTAILVDQRDLRNALANAVERIDALERQASGRDASDEVLGEDSEPSGSLARGA
jgi:hypothetical protein